MRTPIITAILPHPSHNLRQRDKTNPRSWLGLLCVLLIPCSGLAGTLSPRPQVRAPATQDSLVLGQAFHILRDAALTSSQMNSLEEFLIGHLQAGGYDNSTSGITIILHKFGNTPPVTLPAVA
jgi:hypothetical protein